MRAAVDGLRAEKDAQNGCFFDTVRLRQAKVLLVGAGGLGCPIATHLAAAGVGMLTIYDGDTVALKNLNRQFLYTAADCGRNKAEICAERLAAFAPDCTFYAVPQYIRQDNAEQAVKGFDLAITACDTMQARLWLNAACVRAGVPLLDAGIAGVQGQVALYCPPDTACLACCFLETDESRQKQTFGAAAGTVGAFAAAAALSFLSGSTAYSGHLYCIHCLTGETETLPIRRSELCTICGGDGYGR